MTIKICHVISSLEMGGAQKLLEMLCLSMKPPEFKHFVICLGSDTELSKKFRNSGIRVICLEITRSYQGITGIWRLRRILGCEQPQIIHTWLYHADLMATLAMIGKGTRSLLWSVHHANEGFASDKTLTKWIVKLLAILSNRFPAAIVYCSSYASSVHQRLGYKPRRSFVINNGVDTSKFHPSNILRQHCRDEWRLEMGVPVVGMVARYSPIKGHEVFLKMARELIGSNSDIRFLMVGTDIGEDNVELMKMICELGLRNNCLLLGEQPELQQIMNGLDVLVCPSISESFGLVAVEALACGVPVVCSNIEVLESIVGEQFTAPVGDYRRLAEKVYCLVTAEESHRRSIGSDGRARMVRDHSARKMIEEYKTAYRDLSSGSQPMSAFAEKSTDGHD
jgi:glycosyltransferase involved in cell wall biosynthesis